MFGSIQFKHPHGITWGGVKSHLVHPRAQIDHAKHVCGPKSPATWPPFHLVFCSPLCLDPGGMQRAAKVDAGIDTNQD
ncbi:hypothetical protein BgiBS90_021842 [Biomphalaria glabrata]|nr:hypothetical protein BgiBS90_021842 [Biomphalaria glabrata]